MYRNYRVIVNTAAGRRRYMQYLIPYIVASDIVDRYDIWINTHNGADIEFFRRVADRFPKINLVWQPDGVVDGNSTINAFYRDCTDPDAIYFKLDDDIVWMEPGLIEKMVMFRIDNPRYFLVTPLVINNALSTYLLQIEGRIRLDDYYQSYASHPVLWKSGNFAAELHTWFIHNYLKPGKWDSLHLGKKEMGMTRFSNNAVLWFGKEMARFSGNVPGDDEEFLSCTYPTMSGMSNAWNGDAIVAHFAFFPQREKLDRAGILDQYGKINDMQWHSCSHASIYDAVQSVMAEISESEQELMQRESPYRKVVHHMTLRSRVKRFIPGAFLDFRTFCKGRTDRSGYILSDK